ncbi:MAG: hypothetical protein AB202_03060 [Parcubacteria bacterium C7867-007]|nr:MAG: hypothetical protein AB202_03060 [Parcubacteria bacterium C7867-007]
MAAKPINVVEQGLVIGGAALADTIGLIPVVGNIVWFIAFLSLNIYFLIKLGPSYLGGKRTSTKMIRTIISGIIGAIPVVGNIAPELLILTLSTFWMNNKEVMEEEAARQAANDNTPSKISRAA